MFIQEIPMLKYLRDNSFIIAILILAGFLRLWSLSSVPPSPSLDEVSIGYNAFSLLHTGRDEYGYFMPILLRAYDDWRPILYVYLTVPFVGIFGLSSLAVRFPSVLLSLMTIYISVLLVPLLLKKKMIIINYELNIKIIAAATAFLVSISPWQIYLSRLGHEVNLGLFLTVLGIYLFLCAVINQKKRTLVVSGLIFALCFYSYQSQKVIIPILMISLVILYFKELYKFGRWSVFATLLFICVVLPALITSLSPQGMTRFNGTSVFSANQSAYSISAQALLRSKNEGNIFGEIYYNRRFVPLWIISSQYISHFNPQWMFMGESRENHKVPFMGLLYYFEAPFIVLGILFFFLSKLDRRIKIFVAIWFLSSPLPGAITTDAPHAMRSYTFIPLLQMFEALAIVFVLSYCKKMRLIFPAAIVFALIVVASLWQLWVNYFYVFPKTQADSFQSSLFQSMKYLKEHENDYDSIVISNERNLYQSYMYYLFTSSFNPALYQSMGGTKSGGFAEEHRIGKIVFRPIGWNTEKKQARILYIGNGDDFTGSPTVKDFYYPDGKPGVSVISYD